MFSKNSTLHSPSANVSIFVGISVVEQYLAILLAISRLLLPAISFIRLSPSGVKS